LYLSLELASGLHQAAAVQYPLTPGCKGTRAIPAFGVRPFPSTKCLNRKLGCRGKNITSAKAASNSDGKPNEAKRSAGFMITIESECIYAFNSHRQFIFMIAHGNCKCSPPPLPEAQQLGVRDVPSSLQLCLILDFQ